MKIEYSPRQGGKTTRLIEEASKGRYKLIVCHSHYEAGRIFEVAKAMGKDIPMPITYKEFLNNKVQGGNIESFLIDNAEFLITYIANGVPVDTITLTRE